jgi:hypothetical protein
MLASAFARLVPCSYAAATSSWLAHTCTHSYITIVHTYIHTHTHSYIPQYTHTYTHTYIHTQGILLDCPCADARSAFARLVLCSIHTLSPQPKGQVAANVVNVVKALTEAYAALASSPKYISSYFGMLYGLAQEVCMCVCVCVWLYVCVCVYVCDAYIQCICMNAYVVILWHCGA